MKEIWKDVKGYEGMYQVSNMGRVRSLDRDIMDSRGAIKSLKGKILSECFHTNGYKQTVLGRSGGSKYVHRLVAEAFLKNPLNKKEVNHINGDKTDNRVENLEWVTPSENQSHSKSTGLAPRGESHPQSKLTDDQVRFIKKHYKPFDPEYGAKPLAERFGVAKATISKIGNGLKKQFIS